jgi:hypothetical protein
MHLFMFLGAWVGKVAEVFDEVCHWFSYKTQLLPDKQTNNNPPMGITIIFNALALPATVAARFISEIVLIFICQAGSYRHTLYR